MKPGMVYVRMGLSASLQIRPRCRSGRAWHHRRSPGRGGRRTSQSRPGTWRCRRRRRRSSPRPRAGWRKITSPCCTAKPDGFYRRTATNTCTATRRSVTASGRPACSAGQCPPTRRQARCAVRLIRGGTLNAGAAVFYGPGEHRGCRHRPCRRSRACTRRRSPRTVRPPAAPRPAPRSIKRKNLGPRAAAAWASVVCQQPCRRRSSWLVRSSGGTSPFLSGLGRPERRPRKKAGEGPDEYRRIMETRFWDSSGCTGVGSRRVGVVRA